MHYYMYKITNNINGKIYIGIHSTTNIDDGYMGSGVLLNKAIKKYGIEHFTKTILETFNDIQTMKIRELEIVNHDFVKREDTYNIAIGGQNNWVGKVSTADKEGNTMQVAVDDPRYLSGELVHINKNMTPVKDKDGNTMQVSVDDPRYLSGELVHIFKDKVVVKDKDGNTMQVSVDNPRYLSGELISQHKGLVVVKDKDGNKFKVLKDDPRYLSSELVGVNKGITFKFSKPLPICNMSSLW